MKIKHFGRVALASAVGLFALAESASATNYINKRYCGGDNFATCAAVMLDVTGTTVTLRIWNLSGNTAASYGNATDPYTIFNGIGLYNVPLGVDYVGGLTTTGPRKIGNSQPSNWILKNAGNIGFLLDFAAVPSLQYSSEFTNGISSGCAKQNFLPSTPQFLNPCSDPANGSMADWVTFQFQVNQTWDASNAYIMVRGKNYLSGASTECWTGPGPNNLQASCYTVTPEPMTMALLATGLVGLGGVGYIRRRRRQV